MKKTNVQLPEIKLVGITVRTNNSLEANPETAKIGKTISNYFENNLSQKILNRTKSETTYCAYTEYENDENGEYTYFVGEEVDSFEQVDPIFKMLTIPSSIYAKFECGPGKMPMICIGSWKEIWQMQDDDFGGERTYITDFEIYDERAKDYGNTILDIYIGIQK
jgi:predicted transcriptional regulator YdeE